MSETTVAVFFGGNSNEHEISVITGMLAANLLRAAGYRVLPVFLPREGGMMSSPHMRSVEDFRTAPHFPYVRLERGALVRERGRRHAEKIDVALNCCHGGMGEDGTLAALLRYYGVRSASPDAPVSAVFMNKRLSKLAAVGMGLPVLPAFAVREGEWKGAREEVLARAEAFGYPVVVKPCRLGSSIGISVARDAEELGKALTLAYRLDDDALIERYLAGKRDINCAAFCTAEECRLSPLEEVFSGEEVLTFAEKYEGTGRRASVMPADLSEDAAEKVRACMVRIFEEFGVRGVVRGDFLVCGEEVYFNELNTVPGSLACYLFDGRLTESKKFLASLVEEALSAPEEKKEVLVSGILSGAVFSRTKFPKRP